MLQIELIISIFGAAVMTATAILGIMVFGGFGRFSTLKKIRSYGIPLTLCALTLLGLFLANIIAGGVILSGS